MTCFVLTYACGELFPESWYVTGVYSSEQQAEDKVHEIGKVEELEEFHKIQDGRDQLPYRWTFVGYTRWGETVWLSCEERKVDV